MNEKFVPPMTRKYNTALSVNAKLLNFWKICHCTLGNQNDDNRDKYPSKYLF